MTEQRVTKWPPVVLIEWEDATNIATWEPLAEAGEWAHDGGGTCRSVGYLTHECDECIVLSARLTLGCEPQQHGLFERIPKGCITDRVDLTEPLPVQRDDRLPEPVMPFRPDDNDDVHEDRPFDLSACTTCYLPYADRHEQPCTYPTGVHRFAPLFLTGLKQRKRWWQW